MSKEIERPATPEPNPKTAKPLGFSLAGFGEPAIPDEFRSLTTTQHAEEAIKTHPHNLSTKIDLY